MAITAADIAQAAEAINRHPDLSSAARRVGLELLNRVDKRTGLAWPSEARIAESLGVDERTIRRGKAELHALGLLTWVRRGTSWKGRTPIYALAWDRLLNLAATIKAKVKAACDAVRTQVGATSKPAPVLKSPDNRPRPPVGRTFLPAYLTQCLNQSSRKGFWKAPGAPQGQYLTDQQLDARASARFYTALQQLGIDIMAQFMSHPDATALEAAAIRAERFKPKGTPDGLTGLNTLKSLLEQRAMA